MVNRNDGKILMKRSSNKTGRRKFRNLQSAIHNSEGMALVLTLMILALITALVTEFSYGVFTTTSALYNWRDSQRLSFVAKSGVTLAVKTISDMRAELYRFPAKMAIPVENIVEGFGGTVIVTVEDENSRFNLNSVKNPEAVASLKTLLKELKLNEDIAEKILDWMGKKSVSPSDQKASEEAAKYARLDSIDELSLIKGIDQETYEKLAPYVTVYGTTDIITININTAALPVIMSLKDVTKEKAEELLSRRPFQSRTDATGVPVANIIVKPSEFRITVVAEENKIRRMIETVVNISDIGRPTVRYWRET